MALQGIIREKKAGGGSGGFLNGVSGVIKSITFKLGNTGTSAKSGKDWQKYSGVVTVQQDGAEAATEQFIDAGFLRNGLTISADGTTIEGDGNYFLQGDESNFGRFIVSLFEGEGNRLPESFWTGGRNYDAVAGVRVTFARVRDEEATKRLGKSVNKKTGKEYDRDYLVVSEVLAAPAPVATTGKKTAAKATTKATVSTDAADAALVAILGPLEGKTIERAKISGAVIKYALPKKLDHEALRKVIQSDDYIADAAERGLIVVVGEGKSSSLVLAA